jgi:hypothetical protein
MRGCQACLFRFLAVKRQLAAALQRSQLQTLNSELQSGSLLPHSKGGADLVEWDNSDEKEMDDA